MLEIKMKDQKIIENMSEKEALKEAERKIKICITDNVESGKKKYSDYKKLVRLLFDKMYDNQSKSFDLTD